MKIDEIGDKYPILKEGIKRLKEIDSIDEIFPSQEEALKSGCLEGKNLVLAIPTSSGKTLVAELVMLKKILEGRKILYLVPLKALASEKYQEFKEKYEPLGIRVAMSIGDYDSSDAWLGKYDLIISSNEKFDSLLRHGIPWLSSVGLVVIDEIHLLDSPERGPTLEITLTKIKQLTNPQFLALSATINNYKELAEWMGAEAVKSDFRPVKLYNGVCYGKKVTFIPKKELILKTETPLFELVDTILAKNKQSLVFVNTRKGAESAAEKVGLHIKKSLKPEEKKKLMELSRKVSKSLEHSTSQCKRLASCIEMGTAFHHAGEVASQRALIESSFKSGLIKVITATPTLAFGLNTPSHMVIVRDLKRFSSYRGMDYLPVLEVMQMAGRAGRFKYDKEGFAVLLPKNEAEAKYAWDNYINGEPEKIYSKLGVEPVLRTHVLALIAGGVTPTKQALEKFFEKTFYAYQYKDINQIKIHLDKILSMLKTFGFIESSQTEGEFVQASTLSEDSNLEPTKIGRRVSELYIDPLTANHLLRHIKGGINHFGLLQLIANTQEMRPPLSLRKRDFDEENPENIEALLLQEEAHLLEKPPKEWDFKYDSYLSSLKTANMLRRWTEERGEDFLMEKFNITPGELRARLERADWLLYSTAELSLLMKELPSLKIIKKSRLRVKYGVKDELLPLIKLKGVGRARARKLFGSGLTSIDSLRKAPLDTLIRIVGPAQAEAIKYQLGEPQ
jgi:helicase